MKHFIISLVLSISILGLGACGGNSADLPPPEEEAKEVFQAVATPTPVTTSTPEPSPTALPDSDYDGIPDAEDNFPNCNDYAAYSCSQKVRQE